VRRSYLQNALPVDTSIWRPLEIEPHRARADQTDDLEPAYVPANEEDVLGTDTWLLVPVTDERETEFALEVTMEVVGGNELLK